MSIATAGSVDIAQVSRVSTALCQAISRVIEGKTAQIEMAVMVLLAGGHLLVEDIPGVGKTMLAKALGTCINGSVHRIQFTPDLLPSDITGVSIYDQRTGTFDFKPGGIFANIVVGDEINRASPKTQSALLEAMAERQVSVDGVTHRLPSPFMVVATQNPIEMAGTYPLPEAQRDRFWVCIEMGYPTRSSEIAMLDSHGSYDPLAHLRPVTDIGTISALVRALTTVHVSPAVKEYIVDLVAATRVASEVKIGASPRASLHLLRLGRVRAAMLGRDYVIPDDIQQLLTPVLGHRIILTSQSRIAGYTSEQVMSRVSARVSVPTRRS